MRDKERERASGRESEIELEREGEKERERESESEREREREREKLLGIVSLYHHGQVPTYKILRFMNIWSYGVSMVFLWRIL